MTMLNEVEQTIAALPHEDVDSAAVELARAYARELDGAAAWRARADKAAERAHEDRDSEDPLLAEVDALRAKLSERTALVQVGKLLHALLAELQATPKARGGVKAPAKGENKLEAMRKGLRAVP